jgi:hypothetical protein
LSLKSFQNGKGRIGVHGLFGPALGFLAALRPFIGVMLAGRPWRPFFLLHGSWLRLGFGFRPVAEGAGILWPPDLDFNLF